MADAGKVAFGGITHSGPVRSHVEVGWQPERASTAAVGLHAPHPAAHNFLHAQRADSALYLHARRAMNAVVRLVGQGYEAHLI